MTSRYRCSACGNLLDVAIIVTNGAAGAIRVHGKFFAQFHRRGFVTETCDKDAHENAFPVRPIFASLESVAASESLRWLLLITRSL